MHKCFGSVFMSCPGGAVGTASDNGTRAPGSNPTTHPLTKKTAKRCTSSPRDFEGAGVVVLQLSTWELQHRSKNDLFYFLHMFHAYYCTHRYMPVIIHHFTTKLRIITGSPWFQGIMTWPMISRDYDRSPWRHRRMTGPVTSRENERICDFTGPREYPRSHRMFTD